MTFFRSVFIAVLKLFKSSKPEVNFTFRTSWTGYTKEETVPEDDFLIDRRTFTDLSTIGDFYIGGKVACKTLELSCRKANISGKIAIPAGRYEMTMTDTPESPLEHRFGFPLPLLNGIPGREGIRIHPANVWSELEGCIAPGNKIGVDAIYDSRSAFFLLSDEIKKRLTLGKLFLQIVGGR